MFDVCHKATDIRIDLEVKGRSQPASLSNFGAAARLQGREPNRLFQVHVLQQVRIGCVHKGELTTQGSALLLISKGL
jgi:hypothetical protein